MLITVSMQNNDTCSDGFAMIKPSECQEEPTLSDSYLTRLVHMFINWLMAGLGLKSANLRRKHKKDTACQFCYGQA